MSMDENKTIIGLKYYYKVKAQGLYQDENKTIIGLKYTSFILTNLSLVMKIRL